MKIESPEQKQEAIQRVREINQELSDKQIDNLTDELALLEEEKAEKVKEIDLKINSIKEEMKALKDARKGKEKELKSELAKIQAGLGEYAVKEALTA
ncbi:hypothetical protein EHQ82_21445 [Leptospira selangorensis]|uniref:Uncharacterized protein n=1 Tax=Leptospira selangorensis TaxID=2484982 RepID=A0ABY2MXB4_9LEPT|nr:hypothetical protein [Leptospira selangorensis]TGM10937.1 hypothetical protein EHQ82_21445 [Leptospira selangorensis]